LKQIINIVVKQDINFLENPIWVVEDQVIATEYRIDKGNGTYEIKGTEGLPSKFDSIVLYYLLGELLKNGNFENREMKLTRYQIAKNVFYGTESLGKTHYDRIMQSLRRWHGLAIKFEGTFYADKVHTSRLFHIIDGVILNKKQQTLIINFNEQYVQLLKHTNFCKYLNFDEYKKISRSVAARLYEILIKSFKDSPVWSINISNLAEKLTLEKRSKAKDYYPSDVLIKLKPAIGEINEKTDFFINFEYDKKTGLCTFRLTGQEKFKALADMDADLQKESARVSASKDSNEHCLVRVLAAWNISNNQARQLIETYGEEKIKHKLELLQSNNVAVRNPVAWLIKALEEDWQNQARNKQVEEQKLREERKRKQAQEAAQKQLIEKLKQEHNNYLEEKVLELYKLLPAKLVKLYDKQFLDWLSQRKTETQEIAAPDSVYRIKYLKEILLEESDCNFENWATAKGYIVSYPCF
jgi:hypothetical protein